MRDKRSLLTISGVIAIGYELGSLLYTLIFNDSKELLFSNVLIAAIALYFAISIIKLSFKDESTIKKQRTLLVIAGMYLFIQTIISGLLIFIYIDDQKEKKKTNLPVIEKEKKSIKSIILSIIPIILFLLIIFLVPHIKFLNKLPLILKYLLMFIVVIIFNLKYYVRDFKVFIKNIKVYIPFILKRYLIMFITYVLAAMIVTLINKGGQSINQEYLNNAFMTSPLLIAFLSCVYAPIVEEGVFRLDFRNIINNKYVFIIISGVVFGVLHVANNVVTSPQDYLYALVYITMGINLAKAYYDSNNIFVSISIHFIQNALSIVLMAILLLKELL